MYIRLILVLILMMNSLSCEEVCEDSDILPDLLVPSFISNGLLKQEPKPCFIGLQFYPYGSDVWVVNAVNEFYSVERFDQINGHSLVIYWNQQTIPPFNINDPNPVFHPLRRGEKFTVHRFVQNQDYIGFVCSVLEAAGLSTTRARMRVRVVNGQIVESEKEARTPKILPGSIVPVSMDFTYEGPGSYRFDFEANSRNEIEERDTTNNTYVEVEVENLGG